MPAASERAQEFGPWPARVPPWPIGLDRAVDGVVPDRDPALVASAGTTEFLCQLRREFPAWGIIADARRGVWLAVRGKALGGQTLQAHDGVELREQLLAATKRLQDRE
jgi:hypothetical protein